MKSKKKIIIIGAKDKISPEILENIRSTYGDNVEIEIMTREEYISLGQACLEAAVERERMDIENYLKRMELYDYLPPIEQSEKIKPLVRKKIGKPNNKKLSPQPKSFEKRRR